MLIRGDGSGDGNDRCNIHACNGGDILDCDGGDRLGVIEVTDYV